MLSNPAAPTEPLWVSEWSPSLLKPGFQSLSQKRPHYFLNTPVTPWKMNWFSSNWYTKPFLTPRLKNVTLLKVYYCLHWYTLPVSFWHWSFASTSWTPLAEDEAADWIQAGSACLSLPSWLSPAVSRQWPPACSRPWQTAASPFIVDRRAQRAFHAFVHCWWLRLSCGCSLPATVTSSPSLLIFKRQLKTELFARSYPDC